MSRPRYRTLDGLEVELPMCGERFVVVPRTLADSEGDLIWTLEYDDVAPLAPQLTGDLGGALELDFSDGALLVPIARWNARAVTEPALVASHAVPWDRDLSDALGEGCRARLEPATPQRPRRSFAFVEAARRSVRVVARMGAVLAIVIRYAINLAAAALAISFAVATGQWLVSLRDGMSGPEVGNGAVLLVAAVLLSALVRRACLPRWGIRGGGGAVAVGHAAHAIFAFGALVLAAALTAFAAGLGA